MAKRERDKTIFLCDIYDEEVFKSIIEEDARYTILDKGEILQEIRDKVGEVKDSSLKYMLGKELEERFTDLIRHKKIKYIFYILGTASPKSVAKNISGEVIPKVKARIDVSFSVITSKEDAEHFDYDPTLFSDIHVAIPNQEEE